MNKTTISPVRFSLSPKWAFTIVILLWLPYTVIEGLFQSSKLSEISALLLELIPGIVGIAILLASGLTFRDCYFRLERISKKGLLFLSMWFVLLLLVLLTGTYVGWNTIAALLYAPMGAITQELYFRCALLPTMMRLTKGQLWQALLLHSVLFGLWHVGPLVQGAPLIGVVLVMFVPFLSGLVWGWQVQRDKTVVWVVIFHTLTLMFNSFFTWVTIPAGGIP